MRLAIVTDTHFGARQDSPVIMKHQYKFFRSEFFPFVKDPANKIDGVACLGDMFDRRKQTNHWSLSFAKASFFNPLAHTGLPAFAIVGNHDSYFRDSVEVNALSLLLKEYGNLHVVTKPEVLKDFDNILALPWICDDNRLDVLAALNESTAKIVVGHLEIAGFQMYAGSPPMVGGMDAAPLSKFPLVLSGHFHHASRRNNIQYLGTPYEMTWQDYGDQKGFYVLDTATLEIKQVANPHHLFNIIVYDDTATGQKLPDPESVCDQYVKLVVQGKSDPVAFDNYVRKLEGSRPADLQVLETPTVVVGEDDEVPDMDTGDVQDFIVNLVDQYFPKGTNPEVLQIARDRLAKWYHASKQAE